MNAYFVFNTGWRTKVGLWLQKTDYLFRGPCAKLQVSHPETYFTESHFLNPNIDPNSKYLMKYRMCSLLGSPCFFSIPNNNSIVWGSFSLRFGHCFGEHLKPRYLICYNSILMHSKHLRRIFCKIQEYNIFPITKDIFLLFSYKY